MPVYQISSVDTTANTLTSTGIALAGGAEGVVLRTGDRFRLRAIGGALPASTPALVAGVDMFAVRVDDNTIKASDTNAHALASSNIFDLTGGIPSGAVLLAEFNIPYGVPRIQAPGQMVFAQDFNAEWQALQALHQHFVGQSQSVWSAPSPQRFSIIGSAGVEQDPDKTKVLRVGSQLRFAATRTGSNGVLYPLQIPVGAVLSSMTFVYNRAGNTIAFSLLSQDLDTGATASSAASLVNDSSTTGVQAAVVTTLGVDGNGRPTGAAGALTGRADRAYHLLLECSYTSGTPIVYGIGVNQ